MKIFRDGKEYELTPSELSAAYFEQQFVFDLQDVKDELECIVGNNLDDGAYIQTVSKIMNDDALLSDCAIEMRRNIDKYDMDWSYARSDAIKNIACRERARGEGS